MNQRNAKKKIALWAERYARFGYAAKGVVYFVAGILSTQAAFNWGGTTASSSGAIQAIDEQPFGKLMLAVIAFGLTGYALWRVIQAILDPEHHPPGFKNVVRRLGYFINGLIYGGIAFSAFEGLTEAFQSEGDQSTQAWTATVFNQPFGEWLVGTGGAFLVALGFYYFYRAFQKTFRKYLYLREMSPTVEKWAIQISRFGIVSRGIVFVVIGGFLIHAARYSDPQHAHSSEGILKVLDQSFYGSWLLGVVAFGLIAYGLYMGIQARYRRFGLAS